jgi:uncharacterized protein YjbJ (UPF0337 family)
VNKDQVKGKVKDIAGRVERQAGEWTGDSEAQVRGAARQAEGKVQKAWGDAKDSVKKVADREAGRETEKLYRPSTDDTTDTDTGVDEQDRPPHRKAS